MFDIGAHIHRPIQSLNASDQNVTYRDLAGYMEHTQVLPSSSSPTVFAESEMWRR